MFKVLNLYSGIGGNRKLWESVNVTAVENNQEIARIYQDFFPDDNIIIADAHVYLEKHYKEYDFIWSSPPCQSHSKIRLIGSKAGSYDAIMPDMNLWSEIIFLRHFASCPWIVENVKPYYEPLIVPTQKLGRHMLWSNFDIPFVEMNDGLLHNDRGRSGVGYFDIRNYKIRHRKDQIIRNSVDPKIGEYILGLIKKED